MLQLLKTGKQYKKNWYHNTPVKVRRVFYIFSILFQHSFKSKYIHETAANAVAICYVCLSVDEPLSFKPSICDGTCVSDT